MTAYTDQANTLGATQVYGVDFADVEWKDESGNALHLTRVGATTEAGPGDGLATALSCDGVDDYAFRADEAALEIGATHTVCYWVKRNGVIVSFGHEVGKANDSWHTRDRSDGHEWNINGSNSIIQEDVGDTSWHFVVIRQDDGANTRVLRSYGTDGVQLAAEETGVSVGTPNTVQWDFSVGAQDHDGYRRFYDGAFAGLAIFDGIALTDAEIDALLDSTFDSGAAGVTIQASPASLTTAAQTVTPVQAAVAITAVPASAATSAQTVTPTAAPVAIQASPAALSASAQTVTPTQAALVTQASPASLTAAAQTVNPTVSGAPVTVQAAPATVTTAAQTVTPTQAALAVTAAPATLTTTGQQTSPQQAALAVSATSATITATASVVSPQVTSQGVTVQAAPAALATSAEIVTLTTAAATVQADPATITATGQVTQPTVAGFPVVIQAAPANVTTNAQTADVARAGLVVQADPATLSTAAQALVPAFDALVLQAVAAIVNTSASAVLGIEGEKRKRLEGSGVLVGATEGSKTATGFLEGSKV